MIEFEDTELGLKLQAKIEQAAKIASDAYSLMEATEELEGVEMDNWLLACGKWREAGEEYTHFKQEYNDNKRHYILGDFDDT